MASLKIKAIVEAVDRASGPLRGLAGRLANVGGKIGGIGKKGAGAIWGMTKGLAKAAGVGSLLGAGAVGGLWKMMKGFAESGTVVKRAADAAALGASQYQRLAYAAELAGIESGDFATATRKFTLSMGMARAGTGKMYTLLGKVSPEFRKTMLATRSSGEALDVMLEGLAAIKDPAKRAALATAVFGKAGQRMALMAGKGKAAIKAMGDEAERFGLVKSDEKLAAAEDWQKSTKKLDYAMKGLAGTIGGTLVPVLQPMVEEFASWAAEKRAVIAKKVGDAVKAVAKAIAGVNWVKLGDVLSGVWDAISALGSGLAWVWSSVISPIGVSLGEAVAVIVQAWEPVSQFFSDLWTGIAGAFSAAWEVIKGIVGSIIKAVTDLLDILDLLPQKVSDAKRAAALGERGDQVAKIDEFTRRALAGNLPGAAASAPILGPAAGSLGVASVAPQAQVGGEVVVRLVGAPAGTRIESVDAINPRVPVKAAVGARTLARGMP